MRRLIGVALMVDGLATALWFTTLMGSLTTRDAVNVAAIGGRLVAAAFAVTAGWHVSQRHAGAESLATWAALSTAAIVSLGTWFRWLPTSLAPSHRLPVAGMYLLSALIVVWWARRAT